MGAYGPGTIGEAMGERAQAVHDALGVLCKRSAPNDAALLRTLQDVLETFHAEHPAIARNPFALVKLAYDLGETEWNVYMRAQALAQVAFDEARL